MSKLPHGTLKLATASFLAVTILSACNKSADQAATTAPASTTTAPATAASATTKPATEADGLTTARAGARRRELHA